MYALKIKLIPALSWHVSLCVWRAPSVLDTQYLQNSLELPPIGGMRSRYLLHFWKAPALFLSDPRIVLQINKFGQKSSIVLNVLREPMLRRKNMQVSTSRSLTDMTTLGDQIHSHLKLPVENRWQKTISDTCLAKGARGVTSTPSPVNQRFVYSRFLFFWVGSHLWWFRQYFSPNYWKKRQKQQNVDVSSNSCAQSLRCQTSFDLVFTWWFLHYFWPNSWKKRQKPQNVDVSSNSCARFLRCQKVQRSQTT